MHTHLSDIMQSKSWQDVPGAMAWPSRTSGRSSCRVLAAAVAVVLTQAATNMATAAEPPAYSARIDIASHSLADSIQAVAQQTDTNIPVDPSLVTGRKAPAINEEQNTSESSIRLRPISMAAAEGSSQGTNTAGARPAAQAASDLSQASDQTIDEIVVTAQKREERLQDVPISMTVLQGADLDGSTASGITEALSRVPGVAMIPSNQSGGSQVIVRGVVPNGPQFAGPSPTAYYLDSVPFGFTKSALAPDANAYDMDRVEVLRGPQGTLFGASALNGVVRILTKDPDLERTEFKARTSASSTSGGGENYRGDLAFNMPLIEDKLAARAVVGYEDWGGWIDRPDARDVNDVERRNARVKVQGRPTEQLTLGLSAWMSRSDSDAPATSDDNQRQLATIDEPLSTDYDVFGLTVGYDFSQFSFASMTSYIDFASDGVLDIAVPFPTATFLPATALQTALDSRVFAQEINLTSAQGEFWRWTAGAVYRDTEDRNMQNRRQYVTPAVWYESSSSYAVFGELTRRFAEGRYELTGGLRYFEDDVELREVSRSTGIPAGQQSARSDNKFDAVSPRLTLTWHPSDAASVYASYSEGFRSGYDQTPVVRAAAPALGPTDADTLTNYEFGVKGNAWDGRINFDAAVYYMDWQDIQLPLTVIVQGSNFAASVNSESASGLGVDLGAAINPWKGMVLGVNFSWNDLTLDSDVITIATGQVPVALFEKGDRLNLSPEYTAGMFADYSIPLGRSGYMGRISASANYTSELNSRALLGTLVRETEGNEIVTARAAISIDAPTHWSLSLFAENLNDEQDAVLNSSTSVYWSTRLRPRTIGLQFEYKY